MKLHRRAFLASAAGTLAGCLGRGSEGGSSAGTSGGSDGDSDGSRSDDSGGSSSSAGTAEAAASLDHPAAADLADQPFLGPAPETAPATIIAFEDPSCHNCDRFNANTFPELESKLVESGKASFVYRNFPHAFAWGKPAMAALEATYARSETAFWALEHHYFATQEQFSESNVLDLTEQFLASETNIDATAAVSDVETSLFDRAMRRDIDAGKAAGVVLTPTFYLFRDGKFLTEIRGAQSYTVFAQALGV